MFQLKAVKLNRNDGKLNFYSTKYIYRHWCKERALSEYKTWG